MGGPDRADRQFSRPVAHAGHGIIVQSPIVLGSAVPVADVRFVPHLKVPLQHALAAVPLHQVSRDNARLALRHIDEPFFAEDIRERESLLSASITLASAVEINQLFLEYQAAGVPFLQTLRNEPWGAKTFIVKDPDGNLILFASPAD